MSAIHRFLSCCFRGSLGTGRETDERLHEISAKAPVSPALLYPRSDPCNTNFQGILLHQTCTGTIAHLILPVRGACLGTPPFSPDRRSMYPVQDKLASYAWPSSHERSFLPALHPGQVLPLSEGGWTLPPEAPHFPDHLRLATISFSVPPAAKAAPLLEPHVSAPLSLLGDTADGRAPEDHHSGWTYVFSVKLTTPRSRDRVSTSKYTLNFLLGLV